MHDADRNKNGVLQEDSGTVTKAEVAAVGYALSATSGPCRKCVVGTTGVYTSLPAPGSLNHVSPCITEYVALKPYTEVKRQSRLALA